MRSMLQLVGGVAVAGVVAAGSTAFTAAGFTNDVGSPILVGGKVTPTIVGAALKGVDFTYDTTDPSLITSVSIRMAGSSGGTMPTGSRVTIVSAGTKVTGTEFFCAPTVVDTTYQKAVCDFGTALNAAGGSITALSSISISVQGPLVA